MAAILASCDDTSTGLDATVDVGAPDANADVQDTPDAMSDRGAGEIDAVADAGEPDALDAADAADDDALIDAVAGDLPGDTTVPDAGTDYGPIEVPDAFEATGFYRAERAEDGRWWLVTPEGQPFYSVGICTCHPNGSVDQTTGTSPYQATVDAKYADDAAWTTAAGDRLETWGFNTLGAWSNESLFGDRFAYTVILYITGSDWLEGNLPDYFSDEFAARCADVAQSKVAARKDEPQLLGWFLDNELRWGPDWRSPQTLLEDYLDLPEDAPGRVEAEKWRGDPQGFLRVAADKYFEVTTSAVRAVDPNHMILGVRAVSVLTPEEVVEAAGPWLDVFSANNYVFIDELPEALQAGFGPLIDASNFLERYAEVTDLPILITEFSFRAMDSGLPNSYPPIYPQLDTQQDRADAFEAYVEECYRRPWIVGHHWFEWVDEPANGRFDGENNNFGLVDVNDDPWQVLVDRMTTVHARAPHRRADTVPEGR